MNIAKSTLHVQNRAKSLFDMATNAVASPLQNIILQNPLALHQHELELMQRTRFPRRQKRLMRQGVWHAENGCSKKNTISAVWKPLHLAFFEAVENAKNSKHSKSSKRSKFNLF